MTFIETTRPADWRVGTVKSVADVRFSSVDKKTRSGERAVRLCNYMDVYTQEYIRGNEAFMAATATDAEIAQFGLQRGDVLITKDSETPDDIGIPSVIMCQQDGIVCGYHLALLRPDGTQITPVFLAKQLRHHRLVRYFGRMSNGSTRYGLATGAIENAELWLPDIPEQERIGGVLQQVDSAIEQTGRLIEKLKKIKAGLLHDLLTCGIDEDGQIRDPIRHPEQFKDSPLGKVPRDWEVVPIGELGEIKSGGTPSRHVAAFWNGNVPWVTPSELTGLDDMRLQETREKISHAGLMASAATILPIGSLLITTRATIGLVAIAGLPVTTNQGFKNIIPNGNTLSEFYYYCLQMAVPELIRRAIGSTFLEISKTEFERIPIQRPLKEEQIEIARILNQHDGRIQAEKATLRKLTLMKQGLMQDLLTGRVRVPVKLINNKVAKAPAQRKANIYFMRTVLAAEIVAQLHEQPTFGHVKFQKLLFLCERVAELELETQYHRAAAGPHDNRLMRSVDSQMEKLKWFRKVSRGVGANGKHGGWAYERMEKADEYRKWFERYWTPARERIQCVIDLLKPLDTDRCQIVATLYSAWEDFLAAGRAVTDAEIVDEVLTNWNESKQAIPREKWMKALGWMREKGLHPSGCGSPGSE